MPSGTTAAYTYLHAYTYSWDAMLSYGSGLINVAEVAPHQNEIIRAFPGVGMSL